MERRTIDEKIVSTSMQLIPPSLEYNESGTYIKITSNSNVANFGTQFNQTIDFLVPRMSDALIDWSESYFNLDFHVDCFAASGARTVMPWNSSFTPCESFCHSLFSNVSTSNFIDSSVFWNVDNQSAAFVSGIYELLTTKENVVGASLFLGSGLSFSTNNSGNVNIVGDNPNPLTTVCIPAPFVNPDKIKLSES